MDKWNRFTVGFALLLGACDDDPCDPAANTGCDDNEACEFVEGGAAECFPAVVVVGRVFDLGTGAGIQDARIVALDANGSAVSFVATSEEDGMYALQIPTKRTADGTPAESFEVTLRSDATGYMTFPAGIRRAVPIDTANPVETEERYEVQSSVTDIGLMGLPANSPPAGTISGTAAANATGASVLVVAESNGVGYTAIAGRDGGYTIFNVPAGAVSVAAYARGHNYGVVNADVAAGATTEEVNLDVTGAPPSTVSGTVTIVNGQMGEATSVILVVESTFNETLARGETPPGLRSPDAPTLPNVTGAFSIAGVPAGKYVVLAAFENDYLVRDESAIAGTAVLHQEVVAGQDVAIGESFKITGSVDIVGPGAEGAEAVSATPTFTWVDDSAEDHYAITVFDSYGNIVWESDAPRNVVTLDYGGPALKSGMYYQYRVSSIKDPAEVISRSEDLKGVFVVQ